MKQKESIHPAHEEWLNGLGLQNKPHEIQSKHWMLLHTLSRFRLEQLKSIEELVEQILKGWAQSILNHEENPISLRKGLKPSCIKVGSKGIWLEAKGKPNLESIPKKSLNLKIPRSLRNGFKAQRLLKDEESQFAKRIDMH